MFRFLRPQVETAYGGWHTVQNIARWQKLDGKRLKREVEGGWADGCRPGETAFYQRSAQPDWESDYVNIKDNLLNVNAPSQKKQLSLMYYLYSNSVIRFIFWLYFWRGGWWYTWQTNNLIKLHPSLFHSSKQKARVAHNPLKRKIVLGWNPIRDAV